MTDFIIRGDEAFTPEEWEAYQRRREYETDPERLTRKRENYRRWAEQNRDQLRVRNREWTRRKRFESMTDADLEDKICWHSDMLAGLTAEFRRRKAKAA